VDDVGLQTAFAADPVIEVDRQPDLALAGLKLMPPTRSRCHTRKLAVAADGDDRFG
jgi:hypothetical protein